jgi:hypothetical protein
MKSPSLTSCSSLIDMAGAACFASAQAGRCRHNDYRAGESGKDSFILSLAVNYGGLLRFDSTRSTIMIREVGLTGF